MYSLEFDTAVLTVEEGVRAIERRLLL